MGLRCRNTCSTTAPLAHKGRRRGAAGLTADAIIRRGSAESDSTSDASDFTCILAALEHGDANAADKLLPLVYDELRNLAAHKMANEAAGQTRQPTALVHEAWMRLVGKETRKSKIALISSPPCSGLTLSRVERPKALNRR